jgi:raffinose/stachyose/melibiose transport system substrate-binding protein
MPIGGLGDKFMKVRQPGIHYLLVLLALIIFPVMVTFKLFDREVSVDNFEQGRVITEINFISSWGGTDTKALLLQQVLQEFEKNNPGVRIINESMSGTEFLFKLKTNFAQGNDPDVFGLWPGSDIKTLIRQGKVADLTELLAEDEEWSGSFGENAWSYDKFDGRIYGLPCEIIYEGLFVNKDLFNKYGIKVPETYEELKDAVIAFKGHGIIPIAFNATPEGTFLYQNIVMKLGGKEETENPYREGKINQCYIDGMKYVKELYELGAFPKNAFTIDDRARDNLFVEKKAAMIVQGSWLIGHGSLAAGDESVDIVPFPVFKEGKARQSSIIYGLGNGNFHMSAKAFQDKEKRELCIKLLKHLTSVETAKVFSYETSFISNIRIPDRDMQPGRLMRRGKMLIAQSAELVGPTDSFIDRNLWEQILVTSFPQVLEGRKTPEEVFEEMDRRAAQQ